MGFRRNVLTVIIWVVREDRGSRLDGAVKWNGSREKIETKDVGTKCDSCQGDDVLKGYPVTILEE